MTTPRRRLGMIAVLGLGGWAAAAAPGVAAPAAPALSASRACYVNGATVSRVSVTGHGFAPGHEIMVTGGGFSAAATADATGTFTARGPAPTLAAGPRSRRYVLTAADETTPGPTAAVTIHVANLAAAVSRSVVKNVSRDKVVFTFSGFTPRRRIYSYYLRRKVVARARFGRAHGPCGTLRQRALLYPGGHPRRALYRVAFENAARYSPRAYPRVTGRLRILHF